MYYTLDTVAMETINLSLLNDSSYWRLLLSKQNSKEFQCKFYGQGRNLHIFGKLQYSSNCCYDNHCHNYLN